jgi:hypothetical protein
MFSALLVLVAVAAASDDGACRELAVDKRAGEPVFAQDAVPAPCPQYLPAAVLRYDQRRQMVVARADLAAGTSLGLAFLPERPAVLAGESVQIVASIGHVRISRSAVALQPAQAGERFFVRTPDGAIFVAPAISSDIRNRERSGGN